MTYFLSIQTVAKKNLLYLSFPLLRLCDFSWCTCLFIENWVDKVLFIRFCSTFKQFVVVPSNFPSTNTHKSLPYLYGNQQYVSIKALNLTENADKCQIENLVRGCTSPLRAIGTPPRTKLSSSSFQGK